jgi:class 3 adenylate cyclase/tetratricopeptide (TPR) repeat protein
VLVCPSCGRENPEGFRFCGACAAPLAPEEPAGVRKTVTVLFCDLVGSTSMGDRSDPELLREAMGRFHSQLRTILERHGGTVEKFIGDAAMAVFGIPQVHEDDALRAVRAADEIRQAVGGLKLQVRIGVNTGEVVAGEGETLVTGDAVNVAARLERAAQPDQVLIGGSTERLVRDGVRVEPVEPLALKGKAEPVPAYQLLEVLLDIPAFRRPIDAPFVGREAELETLKRALAHAVDEWSPQLTTIVGAPGIGKSRLARELIQRADARILVGRCLSYGQGITYWPLAEIVSQVGDVRSALEDDHEAELASSRISAALGTAQTAASSDEIDWGFRKLFESLARKSPLIVVVDDIHWAEPTLLDLIEYVATFAREARLFVLCIARPDLFELRPTWAAPKPNAAVVTLEPLAKEEIEALVDELRDVSDETRARIVEAAEGNPLFVEQLLAMQAESGDGELEIPPTLQALLAARIDRLEPDERVVIERASIEGRMFHRGSVAELVPAQTRPLVGSCLMTLVRKELIRPDRGTLPGDDGFRFGHILIRDAAYDSIPKRSRAKLHERFADWIDSRLGGKAPDEIVGYHLEQAFRYRAELGRLDATAQVLGRRAAQRLRVGGRRAFTRSDASAAVNLISRAVSLLPPDDPARVDLIPTMRVMQGIGGDLAWAQRVLSDAIAAGDEGLKAHALVQRSFLRLFSEPEVAPTELIEIADQGLAVFDRLGDELGLARAWRLKAQAHYLARHAGASVEASEQALLHIRRAGDPFEEREIVEWLAIALSVGPVPAPEAAERCDRLLDEVRGTPLLEAVLAAFLATLESMRGRSAEAQQLLARVRRAMDQHGETLWRLSIEIAGVALRADDPAAAERELRPAYEALKRMGEKTHFSTLVELLANAVYVQGRYGEAEAFTRECEGAARSNDVHAQIRWRAIRAKVIARKGEFESADKLAREAVAFAAASDFLNDHGDALVDYAEVLGLGGRRAEASTALKSAAALYEQKGNVVSAAKARDLLDELRGASPTAP